MLGQPETEGTSATSSAKRAAEDWEKTMCYIFNLLLSFFSACVYVF